MEISRAKEYMYMMIHNMKVNSKMINRMGLEYIRIHIQSMKDTLQIVRRISLVLSDILMETVMKGSGLKTERREWVKS